MTPIPQVVVGLLLTQVASSPLPSPQRRRFGGRGRGRYGRPPPPRYYGQNTSSSNYFNTVLPLKGAALAGGVGGFALAQVLGK